LGTQSRNAAQLENILGPNINASVFWAKFSTMARYILQWVVPSFENVVDPASVQSDIDRRREQRQSKQVAAKVAAERERMAEWLATYHLNVEQLRSEEEEKKNQKPG
jgi:hypothetical protein